MPANPAQWVVPSQRVRSLVASGRLGTLLRFDAELSAPASADAAWPEPGDEANPGGGVLADPGPHVFDLLTGWLGPLAPVSLVDDSAGGAAAEAIARVATERGITGTVVLSRLRTLRDSIVLTGTQGRVEFDLQRSTISAEPPALLECIDASVADGAGSADAPGEGHAIELLAGLRAIRQRFLHVWEGDAQDARGVARPSAAIAGQSVLVTGGTGFIGARLVEMLVARGADVTVAVRNTRHVARVARFDVRFAAFDLRAGNLDEVVGGHDVVFSLAYDFRRSGAANVALHRKLADACVRSGVRRLVYLSSIAVYDDWPSGKLDERSPCDAPGSEYKTAKRAIEVDLGQRRAAGTLSSAILQPTIVYGPFSAFWTDRFVTRLLAGTVVVPGGGLGTCSGVYVDDVVDAAIAAAGREGADIGPWIISGARPFDWVALIGGYADALSRTLEHAAPADEARAPSRRRADPLAIAQWPPVRDFLAFVRERVGDERIDRLRDHVLALSGRHDPAVYRPADDDPALYLSKGACDIAKARRDLGFAPAFDLDEGLRRTHDYIRWRYAATDAGTRK